MYYQALSAGERSTLQASLKSHRRALQAAIANHTTAVARSIDDNFMSKDGKAAIRSAIDDAVRSIAAARLAVDVVEFRYVTVSRCTKGGLFAGMSQ